MTLVAKSTIRRIPAAVAYPEPISVEVVIIIGNPRG